MGMASLELVSAFDIVNIDTIIERLEIVGLPGDVIHLIKLGYLTDHTIFLKIGETYLW